MSIEVASIPFQEQLNYFSLPQLTRLDRNRLPKHIAIIPDGNRRWAKRRLLTSQEGHRTGADTLMDIVKAAKEIGIKALTFYGFSTENWNRPPDEVDALMRLIATYLFCQREDMVQNGVKFDTIGDLTPFPDFLNEVIEGTKRATQECSKIRFIVALNYGARNELCRAFKAMLSDYDKNRLEHSEIDENTISRYLDTAQWEDPDLLIRTSGEIRVSNFLLWQISYAEIHVAPVLWPDFTPQHLLDAILDYQERERRWGGA